MPPSDDVQLGHMREAVEKSLALWEGRFRPDLEEDETAALATVRLLEILGEAAKNVSSETKEKYRCRSRRRLVHRLPGPTGIASGARIDPRVR
jgi:uncharacterized protein with HEPN domain